MQTRVRRAVARAAGVALLSFSAACAPAPDPAALEALFADARRHDAAGRHDAAVEVYRRILELAPDSFDGHYWAARALDLAGEYDEARQHFARAIDLSSDSNRDQTLRMMGIAWTFVGNAEEASIHFRQVFERRIAAGNPAGAAEVANELGRVYLELGDFDRAEVWYQTGHETALGASDVSAAQRDLAEMRWSHAQARLAARRGRADEAARHVAAVRTVIDRGTSPDQDEQFAYLQGYVAYYLGDVDAALDALERADQADPFILMLQGLASAQGGDESQARSYFEQVLQSTSHAVNNAFARPVARRWLQTGS